MTAAYRSSSSGGVIRVADSAHIPADTRNGDYRRYLAYVDAGGTTDPVEVLELATAQATATSAVNAQAGARRLLALPAAARVAGGELWLSMRYAEAIAAAADGTPTSPEYPLLAAEIPETGANVDVIADTVVAERTALVTAIAAIENVRATAVKAIADAVSTAAVDAVLSGLTWP